jgi:hypothetical protein
MRAELQRPPLPSLPSLLLLRSWPAGKLLSLP